MARGLPSRWPFAAVALSIVAVLVVTAIGSLRLLPVAHATCTARGGPAVVTDEPSYLPGATVRIDGCGFGDYEGLSLELRITRPDASLFVDTVVVVAGDFRYDYVIDGGEGEYLVEVLDAGGVLASTTFLDAHNVDCTASGGTNDTVNCTLTFYASAGGPNPADQTFEYARTGASCSALGSYVVSAGAIGWLSVSPSTLTLGENPSSEVVTVIVASAALTVGSYSGTITPSDCITNPAVTVELTVVSGAANPTLTQACGLDIVLAIDMSGSIATAGATALVKAAAKGFVDAFLPSTPTLIGLVEFSGTVDPAFGGATVVQDLTSDEVDLKSDIDGLVADGFTNWEAALLLATGLLEGGNDRDDTEHPDLLVIFTDGDPTTSVTVGGTDTSQPNAHLAPAIAAADAAKTSSSSAPIRIVAVGVAGASPARLAEISGPNVAAGSVALDTDVVTGEFGELAGILSGLAIELCGGTLTVHKVVDADGSLITTGDQTAAGSQVEGWTFGLTVTGGSAAPAGDDTDASGATVAFEITIAGGTAAVDVQETVKAG
ncbi:MAG: VWA domain-containing protein, partial [Chloroflexi bacterium]|nr:VWA domain-containing protein [Chloroflexota bacterium]